MFTGHWYELLIILVIALVFFGPKRLPELGSSLGKGIREFRKATTELHESVKIDTTESLPEEHPPYTAGAYTPKQTHTAEYSVPPAPAAPAQPSETQHPQV